jgi:hypothetical protein
MEIKVKTMNDFRLNFVLRIFNKSRETNFIFVFIGQTLNTEFIILFPSLKLKIKLISYFRIRKITSIPKTHLFLNHIYS